MEYYHNAVKLGAKITGVKRVIYGHTHEFVHTNFEGIEYLNSGTWSPAFDDVECTKPSSPKTFVWIRPTPSLSGASEGADATASPEKRAASVYEWKNDEFHLLC